MPNGAMAEEVSVQLRLKNPPSVRMITSTRHFVEELCEPLIGTDIGSQVAMVVHELMENLTKYAQGGSIRLEVEILPHQDNYQIRITAVNQASHDQLGALENILKDIAKSEDPRALHLRYMNQSVTRTEGSGLGLSRIRAEADMVISYSRAGDEITICAEAMIPGKNQ